MRKHKDYYSVSLRPFWYWSTGILRSPDSPFICHWQITSDKKTDTNTWGFSNTKNVHNNTFINLWISLFKYSHIYLFCGNLKWLKSYQSWKVHFFQSKQWTEFRCSQELLFKSVSLELLTLTSSIVNKSPNWTYCWVVKALNVHN